MSTNNVDQAGHRPPQAVLITPVQLATWLQISKRSLSRLRSDGGLPVPIRLRGSVRWRVIDIEAWLSQGCPSGKVDA